MPRSNALVEYRREISRYLLKVSDETGLKNQALGALTGVAHTTIGRAKLMKNTMDYTTLLSIAEKTGVSIPDTLEKAAKRHKDGVASNDQLTARARALVEDLRTASPEILDEVAAILRRKSA